MLHRSQPQQVHEGELVLNLQHTHGHKALTAPTTSWNQHTSSTKPGPGMLTRASEGKHEVQRELQRPLATINTKAAGLFTFVFIMLIPSATKSLTCRKASRTSELLPVGQEVTVWVFEIKALILLFHLLILSYDMSHSRSHVFHNY